MAIEVQEMEFRTDKIVLNYAMSLSSGVPLVLLHGGSARWQDFDSIISDLAKTFRLYAPDLRGHGRSNWAAGAYSLQDYTDDIRAFLHELFTEPVFLFGHSLGGMIALMAAAQYPAGVRAVAVGDSPLSSLSWHQHLCKSRDRAVAWRELSGGQVEMAILIEQLKESPFEVPNRNETIPFREVLGEDSPVFERIATNLYQNDPDTISAVLDHFEVTAAGYEMEKVLPAINCPVLFMQADPSVGGLMTDHEVNQAMALSAQSQHVKIQGAGHVLHIQRKDLVLAALQGFYRAC